LKARLIGQFLPVLRQMVFRELRMRYAGSFLGIFWTFVHPVVMLCMYILVFSFILKLKINIVRYGTDNFTFWLVAGLLPWFAFAEALLSSCYSIVSNAHILKKTLIPAEAFPTSSVICSFINHSVAMVIFVVVSAFLGFLNPFYPALVIYALFLFLFALGLSYFVSAVNVFFRDISQLLSVFLNLWLYATPIFYPVDFVPKWLRGVFHVNPMYWIVDGYRSIIFKGTFSGLFFSLAAVCSAAVAIGGLAFFRRVKKGFLDVL